MLALGCAGGPESSPAELALATAAPEEYAAWRAARAALEAARAEAGSALEVSRETGSAAQEDAERARRARDAAGARADAELAAELERANAREAADKQRERPSAEAAMDRAYEAAKVAPLVPLPRENMDDARFRRELRVSRFHEDLMTPTERIRRGIRRGQLTESASGPERWESSLGRNRGGLEFSYPGIAKAHREAWAAFHAIGSRAEAERTAARAKAEAAKAEAQRVYEAAVADAQARFDATLTPSVEAFVAARRSVNAAEGRLERAAPEAWAAFAAAQEAER